MKLTRRRGIQLRLRNEADLNPVRDVNAVQGFYKVRS